MLDFRATVASISGLFARSMNSAKARSRSMSVRIVQGQQLHQGGQMPLVDCFLLSIGLTPNRARYGCLGLRR